jgi:hypothetical protein
LKLSNSLVKSAQLLASSERLLMAIEKRAKDNGDKQTLAPASRKLEQLLRMLAVNDVVSAEDLLRETRAALEARRAPKQTLH